MKRRDMIKKSALGAATLSMGVSQANARKKEIIPQKPLPAGRNMLYRPLGKSGITVSRLGFGSHLSKENLKDEKRRDRQIQEGIENGVTLFDIYDHGTYHQFKPMSKSLAGKRHQVEISLVAVEEDVRAEVEGALRTFNTDYIDLYRIVYRDSESDYLKGDDDLNLLLKMKEESN